uniref:Uncharacterized protein n=1 Tax=Lactuca sativa TaxID=4236 RepID=A0A9R1UU52_LACSA|nr:hypothetical protein LSAT_V11C800428580 [Lactuca sativa]
MSSKRPETLRWVCLWWKTEVMVLGSMMTVVETGLGLVVVSISEVGGLSRGPETSTKNTGSRKRNCPFVILLVTISQMTFRG